MLGSTPTARTSFLIHSRELLNSAGQQKAAIRTKRRHFQNEPSGTEGMPSSHFEL